MRNSRFKMLRHRSILILLSALYLVSCILYPEFVTAVSLSDIKLDALDKPIKEKWGRDPFVRYGDKMAKLKGKTFREDMPVGLKITGIISDGKKAVAIINGGFYRKNERVNNFMIVDIAKDRVSLEKNGKRFYLGVEKFAMETRRDNAMDGDKGKDKKDDKDKDDKEARE